MSKSKEEIIEFLLTNRLTFGQKFKRRNENDIITKEEHLNKWLLENNIIFNFELTQQNITNYLFNLNHNDLKCSLDSCNNIKKFDIFPSRRSRTYFGYYKFCSNECINKYRSIKQMGNNNTSHRMTKEQCTESYKKASNTMKKKIADDYFYIRILFLFFHILNADYINEKKRPN